MQFREKGSSVRKQSKGRKSNPNFAAHWNVCQHVWTNSCSFFNEKFKLAVYSLL